MPVAWMVAVLLVLSALYGTVAWQRRARARGRLFEEGPADEHALGGRLRGWLERAGLRQPSAPSMFVVVCAVSVGFGLALALAWDGLGVGTMLAEGALQIPGPAGALAVLVLRGAPFVLAVGFSALPWLYVRRRRRERVAAIEADLPVTLELMATLSEAGVGFDSAAERVIEAQGRARPLGQELRGFRRDLLAGMRRIHALARLAARVELPAMAGVTSALIQAEQIGSGISEVLRTQAEDLRQFRRERSLAKAEALEVKLVFPLVLCFLPGLFVAVAGPSFYQFIQLIDRVIRGGTG